MTGPKLPLEIEDIKRLIPQRFPFLMIDRVLEASPEKVVAIKNVTANEPFFAGHFPDQKVMPGVLTNEAMVQAGIILHRQKFPSANILFLVSLKTRFYEPVFPGDQLTIRVSPVKMFSKMGIMKALAFVGDNKIAESEFAFGTRDSQNHK